MTLAKPLRLLIDALPCPLTAKSGLVVDFLPLYCISTILRMLFFSW